MHFVSVVFFYLAEVGLLQIFALEAGLVTLGHACI